MLNEIATHAKALSTFSLILIGICVGAFVIGATRKFSRTGVKCLAAIGFGGVGIVSLIAVFLYFWHHYYR